LEVGCSAGQETGRCGRGAELFIVFIIIIIIITVNGLPPGCSGIMHVHEYEKGYK
jgi:hypothetical protein